MENNPADQPAVPSYALHSNALDGSEDYREDLLACKPNLHACKPRTEAATQVVQLITAVLGLLGALLPLISRLT